MTRRDVRRSWWMEARACWTSSCNGCGAAEKSSEIENAKCGRPPALDGRVDARDQCRAGRDSHLAIEDGGEGPEAAHGRQDVAFGEVRIDQRSVGALQQGLERDCPPGRLQGV